MSGMSLPPNISFALSHSGASCRKDEQIIINISEIRLHFQLTRSVSAHHRCAIQSFELGKVKQDIITIVFYFLHRIPG